MINLYSDTQTLPTPRMLEAMTRAELGDDVNRADPTVNRLEERCAELFGKEAALLVPSGTMANLVSLMAHGGGGDEGFIDRDAHVYNYESGGLASIAGYIPTFYESSRGRPDPESFRAAFRPSDVHFPRPRLLWLENTHNRGGGTVLRPELQASMVAIARRHGLRVHLDGARIFNAAVALDRPVAEIVRDVDSVGFCLSKGLSCPVGSVVVGERSFVDEARRCRKRLGGGMRQAGIIAACGLVALEDQVDRLAEDHANARQLADAISDVPGIAVDEDAVETNMVFVTTPGWAADSYRAKAALEEEGVLASEMSETVLRLVTHRHFTAEQIPEVAAAFHRAAARLTETGSGRRHR